MRSCSEEIFAACHRCDFLLCWNHFMEDIPGCKYHGKGGRYLKISSQTKKKKEKHVTVVSKSISDQENQEHPQSYLTSKENGTIQNRSQIEDIIIEPEEFIMEGAIKETDNIIKKKLINKNKLKSCEILDNNTLVLLLKKQLQLKGLKLAVIQTIVKEWGSNVDKLIMKTGNKFSKNLWI